MFETLAASLLLASSALSAAYWICLILGGGLLLLTVISAGGGHSDAEFDTHAGLHVGDAGDGGAVDFDADVSADVDADFAGDVDADIGADVDADFAADADFDIHSGAHEGFDAVSSEVAAAHAGGGPWALSTWLSVRFVVFFMAVFGALGVTLSSLTALAGGTVFAFALIGGIVVGQTVQQLIRAIQRSSGNSATRPQDYVNRLARVTIAIQPPHKGEIALQVRNAERYVPADGSAGHVFRIGDEVVVTGYRAGVARVVSRDEYERQAGSHRPG